MVTKMLQRGFQASEMSSGVLLNYRVSIVPPLHTYRNSDRKHRSAWRSISVTRDMKIYSTDIIRLNNALLQMLAVHRIDCTSEVRLSRMRLFRNHESGGYFDRLIIITALSRLWGALKDIDNRSDVHRYHIFVGRRTYRWCNQPNLPCRRTGVEGQYSEELGGRC